MKRPTLNTTYGCFAQIILVLVIIVWFTINLSNGLRRVNTLTFAFGTIADKIACVEFVAALQYKLEKGNGKGLECYIHPISSLVCYGKSPRRLSSSGYCKFTL